MKELQELVKDGKLSQTLMSDKEFVKQAKEILKSENIEADDKNLVVLMDEIENKLKAGSAHRVGDEELANVAGGVTKKTAIITASSVAGAVAGALVSNALFPITSMKKDDGGMDLSGLSEEFKKKYVVINVGTGAKPVTNYGAVAGSVAAAGGGALVGGGIAKLICDRFGIA